MTREELIDKIAEATWKAKGINNSEIKEVCQLTTELKEEISSSKL